LQYLLIGYLYPQASLRKCTHSLYQIFLLDKLDSGVGVCGKDGQSVPVGVGQPSLKIDELTVGGTQV
jgi:hypothetical protein